MTHAETYAAASELTVFRRQPVTTPDLILLLDLRTGVTVRLRAVETETTCSSLCERFHTDRFLGSSILHNS